MSSGLFLMYTKSMEKSRKSSILVKKASEIVKNDSKPVKSGINSIVNRKGRPTKYNAGRIDQVYEYIEGCESKNALPTIEGYAWFIGTHRDTVNEWERKHKHFSDATKRLKTLQSAFLQSGIVTGEVHPAGGIFLLKNNHKFVDKHEVTHVPDEERIDGITYLKPKGAKDASTESEADD